MAKFTLAAIAVFLVVIAITDALHCFACGHVDDNVDFENKDVSCKADKKPKDKFSLDCSELEYTSIGEGRSIGVPKGSGLAGNGTSLIARNQQVTYSCVKATADGKNILRQSVKAVLRTCLMTTGSSEKLADVCYADENSKLQEVIKEPWLKTAATEFQGGFTGETKIGICSCSSDDCNGTMSSVTVSATVLLASIFLANFGKFL